MTATSGSVPDTSVLDNPAWGSLTGVHADMAIGGDLARHYPLDVSVFAGLHDVQDPAAWAELAALSDPGQSYGVISVREYTPPTGWERPFGGIGLQLIGPDVYGEPDPETTPLTAEHIDAILELIELTRPGPFNPRTIELGGYVGIWREDLLRANGYNEAFVGWGREDSELAVRLLNGGVRRLDVRGSALCYHLWHAPASRAAVPGNDELLAAAIKEGAVRCANGVQQYLNTGAAPSGAAPGTSQPRSYE